MKGIKRSEDFSMQLTRLIKWSLRIACSDVTAAILVYQNKEIRAILMSRNIHWELNSIFMQLYSFASSNQFWASASLVTAIIYFADVHFLPRVSHADARWLRQGWRAATSVFHIVIHKQLKDLLTSSMVTFPLESKSQVSYNPLGPLAFPLTETKTTHKPLK